MKTFLAFVRKEFYHIFRDRQTMLILLLMPVVQILLFGYAITTEVQNTSIAILDNAKDTYSRDIIKELSHNPYFDVKTEIHNTQEIDATFRKGKVRIVLVFPADFREKVIGEGKAKIQLIADASDPNEANIISNYVQQVIMQYTQSLSVHGQTPMLIEPEVLMLYNPQLKSAYNFVPGVMGLILMLVCTLMTSVSIVREKELGTMEVLLVSPLKPLYIILAKAIPYLVLSFVNVLTIILLSVFILKVPVEGSIALLFGVSTVYILVSLALGILISTVSPTQQVAMIFSLVGLMLPTILLSGLMFPLENMPLLLQWLSNIVPARWYIEMVKIIMIKGLGFAFIWKDFVVLVVMALILLGLSVKRFKVRL
ncbi:MAG: ABC transporter permease [Bacteroidales bacterium]